MGDTLIVLMVVVRELFSPAMSVISLRIRAHRSEVMRTVYHMVQVSIYCCVLTTVDL